MKTKRDTQPLNSEGLLDRKKSKLLPISTFICGNGHIKCVWGRVGVFVFSSASKLCTSSPSLRYFPPVHLLFPPASLHLFFLFDFIFYFYLLFFSLMCIHRALGCAQIFWLKLKQFQLCVNLNASS